MGRIVEKIINSSGGFFITGTGTDVGKTYVSAILLKYTEGLYFKPIQTGRGDIAAVKEMTKLGENHFSNKFYHFKEPVSPNIAAEMENRAIEIDKINLPHSRNHRFLIVEGAGGVYTPLSNKHFMLDLIQKLSLPVVIVAEDVLGTLNHTLLTYKTLVEKGCEIAFIVLNKYKPAGYNVRCLHEIVNKPILRLPYYSNFPNTNRIKGVINESI
ncbi:Dethiobiotin synthetase [Flexistipes sinusarabici DSM 4947]|uniref:ATP-dependent dethiobiotin synthetase BioD n=1 Tax=Flexistipes sinusarabici (strain ATCC 49648 / DSM 4947 / MAS 10) TaxID=717231 RepID=F8E3L1_FLESM|nr:dethiobiotin synthase [Flexistipes sinusarabici]AEI14284.1 Dethiobiotin synthetase [Flexistipes sinusarabici DSM 4947]